MNLLSRISMIQILMTIVLIGIIPIKTILKIQEVDEELPKITRHDRILLYAASIIEIVVFIFTLNQQQNLIYTLSILVGTCLLNITSYMDEKIQSFHLWICLLGILIQAVLYVISIIKYENYFNIICIIAILAILVAMLVTSLFGGIGLGDLLLYVMIALSYLTISHIAHVLLAVNIVVSYIVFLIRNIMRKKDINKSNPFTLSIAIISFIINSTIWII